MNIEYQKPRTFLQIIYSDDSICFDGQTNISFFKSEKVRIIYEREYIKFWRNSQVDL